MFFVGSYRRGDLPGGNAVEGRAGHCPPAAENLSLYAPGSRVTTSRSSTSGLSPFCTRRLK